MIKFEGVSLAYRGKQVISNLSLEIKPKERIIVWAPSGFGKTSLLRLLLGFAKPAQGKIFFEDKLLDENTVWLLRRKAAYLDQDISLPESKVKDWFEFLFSLQVNAQLKLNFDYLGELFDYFELKKENLDKDISELSGGQRQRIGLISAVLLKRSYFLLDEPTSFLDHHLKEKTADFFLKQESTLFVVSHDYVWQKEGFRVFDLEKKTWLQ